MDGDQINFYLPDNQRQAIVHNRSTKILRWNVWNPRAACTLSPNSKDLQHQLGSKDNPMKISPKKLISTGLFAGAGLLVLLLVTAAGGGFPIKLNPFITQLETKLDQFNEHAPEDRVYLHQLLL